MFMFARSVQERRKFPERLARLTWAALLPALLLPLLFLIAPSARAGQYVPSYSGGTVQCSNSGYNLQPDYSLDTTTKRWGGGGPQLSYSPSVTAFVTCSGTITTTFAWVADPNIPNDTPPASVLIEEDVTAT
jgi:hypothetical protein